MTQTTRSRSFTTLDQQQKQYHQSPPNNTHTPLRHSPLHRSTSFTPYYSPESPVSVLKHSQSWSPGDDIAVVSERAKIEKNAPKCPSCNGKEASFNGDFWVCLRDDNHKLKCFCGKTCFTWGPGFSATCLSCFTKIKQDDNDLKIIYSEISRLVKYIPGIVMEN
jgi:hypothetical protein